jgi:acylphosphatase
MHVAPGSHTFTEVTFITAILLARIAPRGLFASGVPRYVIEQKEAKRFHVFGRVQGVGYRFFAQRIAEQFGISGHVKNLPDGRVEVYAVGTATQLSEFRRELYRGPSYAQVDEVNEVDAKPGTESESSPAGFSIE